MKDELCKKSEEAIRKYMYDNHRDLFNKFITDISFPHDYNSGVGIIIDKPIIIQKCQNDLEKFEQIIFEQQRLFRQKTR
jgi:hypothetical protein